MNYKDKNCIIRTNRAGVFFANVKDYDSTTREAVLTDCRRLWYWDGAASLSQLAMEGISRPHNCKFTVTVPEMTVMEVIEIIPCTDKAEKSISGVKEWRA